MLSTGRSALFLVFALAVGAPVTEGCKPRIGTPEDTLRTFLTEVKARRSREAWALLSSESKRALLDDAAAVARAAGDEPVTDPARLLFERAELVVLRGTEAITLASRPSDKVVLRVALASGKSASVGMVREGEDWRVDLMGSLQPIPMTATSTPATVTGTQTATSASPER